MGTIVDIRIIKKEIRKKYRSLRENISPLTKKNDDEKIFSKIISMKAYKESKTIFCFISTNIEVDTIMLIEQALLDKKIVAVPKCINKNGGMEFFEIKSFDDVEISMYNLLEPKAKICKKITDFTKSICILPGFAFDREGYRIGFGKGYYDRFLNKYTGVKIGVCYNNCITNSLPRGRFDVAADYIVTSKYIMTINKDTKKF